MTAERSALIEKIMESVPLAHRADDEMGYHIERGDRAVAVDDDYDDTGVEFVLNRLQCVERTPDSETWEFVGDPVHCETFSSAEELATQWLRG